MRATGQHLPTQTQQVPTVLPSIDDVDSASTDDDNEVSDIVFSNIEWKDTPEGGNTDSEPELTPRQHILQPAATRGQGSHTRNSNDVPAEPQRQHPSVTLQAASGRLTPSKQRDPQRCTYVSQGPSLSLSSATSADMPSPGWLAGSAGMLASLVRRPESSLQDSGVCGCEEEIAADVEGLFHRIVQEDQLLVSTAEVLDTNMGLGLDDLDDLISRLRSGLIDISSTRPSTLPPPESLFTDSDDDAEEPAALLTSPSQGCRQGTGFPTVPPKFQAILAERASISPPSTSRGVVKVDLRSSSAVTEVAGQKISSKPATVHYLRPIESDSSDDESDWRARRQLIKGASPQAVASSPTVPTSHLQHTTRVHEKASLLRRRSASPQPSRPLPFVGPLLPRADSNKGFVPYHTAPAASCSTKHAPTRAVLTQATYSTLQRSIFVCTQPFEEPSMVKSTTSNSSVAAVSKDGVLCCNSRYAATELQAQTPHTLPPSASADSKQQLLEGTARPAKVTDVASGQVDLGVMPVEESVTQPTVLAHPARNLTVGTLVATSTPVVSCDSSSGMQASATELCTASPTVTVQRYGTQSSTDGDDHLVAVLPEARVVHVRREKGSKAVAAGTVFLVPPTCKQTMSAAPTIQTDLAARVNNASVLGVPISELPHARSETWQPARLQPPTQTNHGPGHCAQLPSTIILPDSAADFQQGLQQPVSKPTTASPSPKTVLSTVVPLSSNASDTEHDDVPSSLAGHSAPQLHVASSAAQVVANLREQAELLSCLPLGLAAAQCFSLRLCAPGGLHTLELAAILRWLLLQTRCSAGATPSGAPSASTQKLPAFAVVGLRLVAVPAGSSYLPEAARAQALTVQQPHQRVLVVHCVPVAQSQLTSSSLEQQAEQAKQCSAAMLEAMKAVKWQEVTGAKNPDTGMLGAWVTACSGAGPWGSNPGPLHLAVAGSTRPDSCQLPRPFVCCISEGVFQQQDMLPSVLEQASAEGLCVAGLQVLYVGQEACSRIAQSTPHHPHPASAFTALALCGHNSCLSRWQHRLGPSDYAIASKTDPCSLHAQYGQNCSSPLFTTSYDSRRAVQELQLLFQCDAQSIFDVGPELSQPATALVSVAENNISVSTVHVPTVDCSWRLLPAEGRLAQFSALFSLCQLLQCGFMLKTCTVYSGRAHLSTNMASNSTVLAVEVAKEEAGVQLDTCLAAVSGCSSEALSASSAASVAQYSAGPAYNRTLHTVDLQLQQAARAVPTFCQVDEMLSAAGWQSQDSIDASHGVCQARGIEQLVCVALQGSQLNEGLVALLRIFLSTDTNLQKGSDDAPANNPLELVAFRYLPALPANACKLLSPVVPSAPSVSALVIKPYQPVLMAVFHGPDAQQTVSQHIFQSPSILTVLLSPGSAQSSHTACNTISPSQCRVAATTKQADAKYLLAAFFTANQVTLNSSFCRGQTCPATASDVRKDTAASIANNRLPAATNALLCLLQGPHPSDSVCAIPTRLLSGNAVPRLLKLVYREQYQLQGMAIVQLTAGHKKELGFSTSCEHALLVSVSRNNAVRHLHKLLQQSGLAQLGISSFQSPESVDKALQDMHAAPCIPVGSTAASSRRLRLEATACLLQVAPLVILPTTSEGVTCMDWQGICNLLEALMEDGFRLASVYALRIEEAQAAQMSSILRLSQAQLRAVRACPGCNLLAVAVARNNAVMQVQMKFQEAAARTSATGQPLAAALASLHGGLVAPAGSAAAVQQQMLFLFDKLYGLDGIEIVQD